MFQFKSEFLKIMQERGFINQISDPESLDQLMSQKFIPGYIGFDPTAPNLHIGNLIQIMMLYWMQQTGHKPIVLIGGATALIGDPSFRKSSREVLTQKTVSKNISEIIGIFENYIHFGNQFSDAIIVNNTEWLNSLNYLNFLRKVGKHFSINRILSFEYIKSRLKNNLLMSFSEFNYLILQSYDFIELNHRYDVLLQMGGSDQWGNIVSGIDLASRMKISKLYALTSPLITTSSGIKMGKSLSNAIWINPETLTSYEYWQYWRNVSDKDVSRFLKFYTKLPMDEIRRLELLQGSEINIAKKILATEATKLLYGQSKSEKAYNTSIRTFEKNEISNNLPKINIQKSKILNGISIISILLILKIATTKSDARRKIQNRSIQINDQTIEDSSKIISVIDLQENFYVKISFGKKKHYLVEVVS